MAKSNSSAIRDADGSDPAGAWNPGPIQFAPGVVLTRTCSTDEYVGTADALVAAGVCRQDQLPGQPGRGKTMCTYFPDGSPKNRSGSTPIREGAKKIIKRCGQFLCEIRVKRTGHALEYWEQLAAQARAEMEARRQEAAAAQRNKEAESRPISYAEGLHNYLSGFSDDQLDLWVERDRESHRKSHLETVRLVERIKADKRQALLLIARTEGAVIFPKVWQKG